MKAKMLFVLMLFTVISLVLTTTVYAEKLPVFKLKQVQIDQAQANSILTDMNKGQGQIQKQDRGNAMVSAAGKKIVEIDKTNGRVFAADTEKLWNPDQKPNLPSQQQAKTIADNFINKHKLMSKVDGKHSRLSAATYSQTIVGSNAQGSQPTAIDTQVNYNVEVNVNRGGKAVSLPVVGGGGKFKVSVGDKGDVVGFHGNWRGIDKVNSEEEILSQAAAEQKFKSSSPGMNLTKMESSLAYAPTSTAQGDFLAPVWVVKGSAKFGNEEVQLRNAIIPATQYGPSVPTQQVSPRNPNAPSPPPASEKQQSKFDFITPAQADYYDKSFGVSFIGASGGIPQSYYNAWGFANRMRAAGWNQKFIWGDYNAWEADWRRNNNVMVDNVDFLFYTGHANANGWALNPPDDNFLSYTEVQALRPDLYGNNQLEWLVIAACGPLQTSSIGKWWAIFNKLHVFMGYGTVTYDQAIEGPELANLTLAGWPVIEAWFRTAYDAQPAGCIVVAMWPSGMRYDRIWGAPGSGSGLPDPVPGTQLWYMTSGT